MMRRRMAWPPADVLAFSLGVVGRTGWGKARADVGQGVEQGKRRCHGSGFPNSKQHLHAKESLNGSSSYFGHVDATRTLAGMVQAWRSGRCECPASFIKSPVDAARNRCPCGVPAPLPSVVLLILLSPICGSLPIRSLILQRRSRRHDPPCSSFQNPWASMIWQRSVVEGSQSRRGSHLDPGSAPPHADPWHGLLFLPRPHGSQSPAYWSSK
jgi:hypothetical protein